MSEPTSVDQAAQRQPLGAVLRDSLRWTWPLVLRGLGVIFLLVLLLPDANEPVNFLGLLRGTAVWTAVLFVALFVGRALWSSRPLLDRAFAWAGFAATFFGLVMLLVFCLQLVVEAHGWFTHTPRLVERHNARLKQQAEESTGAGLEKTIHDGLARVDEEMQRELDAVEKQAEAKPRDRAQLEAKRAAIRADFEKIRERRRANLELTAKEKLVEYQRNYRPDTSPLGVLGHFLTHGPSDLPQDSGIWPALLGSLFVAFITILFAVPVGVAAALYLEEYRAGGWLNNLIQVNINNLAGVPSVVYGILGAFVFVELIFKPLEAGGFGVAARNVLGGGLTLGLLTLPVVIVAAQEAIRAVPVSIRHGAYALGATRWQVLWHHVLPLARPGILTGTILSLSRAIGEAAPLVLFGALLFVNENPSLFSRFTILPMQIFGWADLPPELLEGERVEIWRYNAAMASLVLLAVLLALNAVAIVMRNRGQRRAKW
jgi:phosphate transport system permease protein